MGGKGVWLPVIAVDVSSGIVYLLFSAFDFNGVVRVQFISTSLCLIHGTCR